MGLFLINATDGHAEMVLPDKKPIDRHDGFFQIRDHKTRIRIKQHDQFATIIDNFETSFNCEKIELYNKGFVKSIDVEIAKELNEREQRINYYRIKKKLTQYKFYIHTVKYEGASIFKKHSFLDDYTYSLLKIYKRYVKPARHFGRVITELPEVDFETLQKERIYVDRTLFGRLINALPYQNRLQFILFIIDEFKEADLRKIKFSAAFPLLKEFVNSGVIETGKYLIKSEELIERSREIFNGDLDIGFAYEDYLINKSETQRSKEIPQIDYIKGQANLFRDVFNIDENFDELFTGEHLNYSKEDREIFDKTFNQRAWPVDLNTDYR